MEESTLSSEKKPVVVAVSGYFVYPHVGHIRLFDSAKKLGDKLVVILNNDKQQEMKYGKVIVPEENRMEVVKALRVVDEVVLSVDDDRTICKTLEKIKPDIFANGGDRHQGEVPEAVVCRKHGIKMEDGVGGDKADATSRIRKELESTK